MLSDLVPTDELPFDERTSKALRSFIFKTTYEKSKSEMRVAHLQLLTHYYSTWPEEKIKQLLEENKCQLTTDQHTQSN